jgi:hypothetical protein
MVVLNLTKAQASKMSRGCGVQIPHHQLVSGSGEYPVEVDFDKKTHNRLHRNVVNGKGFRIPKNVLNVGKQIGSQAVNLAAREGSKALTKQINSSKYIPDELKGSVNNLQKAGINELNKEAKNRLQGDGFFDSIGKAFKPIASIAQKAAPVLLPVAKQLAPLAAGAAANYVAPGSGGVVSGVTKSVVGKGGKFRKGSQEAKEHMAALRARKTKGTGFFSDIAKSTLKAAAPIAIDAAAKGAKSYVSGSGLKVKNPRKRIPNSNLIIGTPQVSSQGGSFGSYGYAT